MLIHDMRRYHRILTVPENLLPVCRECHSSGQVNAFTARVWFWKRQCKRYGEKHMRDWYDGLPLKVKKERFE
jgi:ribosomal protein L32